MIPFPAAIPWRLIGYGVAAVSVLALGWRVTVWHSSHEALPGVQAALKAEEQCEDGSKCYARQLALQEVADREQKRIEEDYLRDLEELRRRPPAPAVRLCRPAGPSGVSGAGTPGAADGAAGRGELPLEASGDIGQRLFDLADDADAEALKLRHLQEWNRALSAPSELAASPGN